MPAHFKFCIFCFALFISKGKKHRSKPDLDVGDDWTEGVSVQMMCTHPMYIQCSQIQYSWTCVWNITAYRHNLSYFTFHLCHWTKLKNVHQYLTMKDTGLRSPSLWLEGSHSLDAATDPLVTTVFSLSDPLVVSFLSKQSQPFQPPFALFFSFPVSSPTSRYWARAGGWSMFLPLEMKDLKQHIKNRKCACTVDLHDIRIFQAIFFPFLSFCPLSFFCWLSFPACRQEVFIKLSTVTWKSFSLCSYS